MSLCYLIGVYWLSCLIHWLSYSDLLLIYLTIAGVGHPSSIGLPFSQLMYDSQSACSTMSEDDVIRHFVNLMATLICIVIVVMLIIFCCCCSNKMMGWCWLQHLCGSICVICLQF